MTQKRSKKIVSAITILVDADMMVYHSCASCEREIDWGDDLWTLHTDFNEALEHLQSQMDYYIQRALTLDKYSGEVNVIYAFSDDNNNFRKGLLPTYKLNRVGKRKPLAYAALKQWVIENWVSAWIENLEADDVIGLIATGNYKGNNIIISADKDMKTIPTKFYNFLDDTLSVVSDEEAQYNLLFQTLIGDTADNYSGCPKVGKVKAERILNDNPTWGAVVECFKKAGQTEEDALLMARVAHILQDGDYDFEKGTIKLWTPESLKKQKI